MNTRYIANLCFERSHLSVEQWRHTTIGALQELGTNPKTYRVRVDVVYAGWFIGNASVEDAPYIAGDLEYHGQKVGHIQTRDDEEGRVQYFGEAFGLPICAIWKCATARDPERFQLWYVVKQEEEK